MIHVSRMKVKGVGSVLFEVTDMSEARVIIQTGLSNGVPRLQKAASVPIKVRFWRCPTLGPLYFFHEAVAFLGPCFLPLPPGWVVGVDR